MTRHMLHDLLDDASITYRQLDYWCRKGWINGTYLRKSTDALTDGGSGSLRVFEADEYRVALYMGWLVRAGLTPELAATTARTMVASGSPTVRLAPRISITVWAGG